MISSLRFFPFALCAALAAGCASSRETSAPAKDAGTEDAARAVASVAAFADDFGAKQLLALADIVTPNLTEACRLLDRPYPAGGRVEAAELEYMAAELAAQGPSQVVITGLSEGEMIENFVYEAGRGTLLKEKKVGGDRSGSGDAFAAIVKNLSELTEKRFALCFIILNIIH